MCIRDSQYDLRRLPGIGEKRAQDIVDYREAHGPFQSVDELDNVSGIGPGTVSYTHLFHVGGASVTLTSLAIAAIAGIALNAILPGKDYEFGADVTKGRSGDFGRY